MWLVFIVISVCWRDFTHIRLNITAEKRQPDGCLDDMEWIYWLLLSLLASDGAVADVIPVEHAIPADLLG